MVQRLKQESELFWKNNSKEEAYLKYYETYINELLWKEVGFISAKKNSSKMVGGTLVFIVGFSLEPLLLSICLIKPERVMLVLNKMYGQETGKSRYRSIVELTKKIRDIHPVQIEEFLGTLTGDGPNEVFDYLQTRCKGYKDLIIDVTGGKKSMVSGAFLYAAYNGTKITYVDFDRYHEKLQRPFGYSCRINELDNPMKDFALRDWAQVKNLYEKYSFAAALEVLRKNIVKPGNFRKDQLTSLSNLQNLLEMYKFWDMSDFESARNFYEKSEISHLIQKGRIPSLIFDIQRWDLNNKSIKDLGNFLKNDNIWEIEKFGKNLDSQILGNPKLVGLYAQNELKKAQTLKDNYADYRSSFFKSAAVSEIMIRARIFSCILCLNFELNGLPLNDVDIKTTASRFLVYGTISQYIKLLKNGSSENQNKLDSSNKPCAYFKSSDFENLKSSIGNDLQSYHKLLKQIEKLSLLRNKTVHGVLPISKEMAEAAYTIALDNFDNYLTYFLNQEDKNYVQESEYDILPWEAVKVALQLNFVPQKNV